MDSKKYRDLLLILVSVVVTTSLVLILQAALKEERVETEITTEAPTLSKETNPTKKDSYEKRLAETQRIIKKQLDTFIPVFYSEGYAESNHKSYKDYVTPAFYERTEKARNKKGLDNVKEKTSTYFDGLSFYTALGTSLADSEEVTVLTTINISKRSDHSPDLNRSFLLEITLKKTDTWRVDKIAEKNTNPY